MQTLHVNGVGYFNNNWAGTYPTLSVATGSGTVIGWNGGAAVDGASDLINFKGAGTGGFNFALASSGGVVTSTPMVIKGSGNVGIGTTNPNSTVQVAGSLSTAIGVKTSSYTLTTADSFLIANAAGGALTVTLPTAVGTNGRTYTIKKSDSSANQVTILAASGQTIEGSASLTLNSQWQYSILTSDGLNWIITGGNTVASNVAFAFTNVPSANVSTQITSDSPVSTGTGSVSVSVTGSGSPQISINNGPWSTSGTITAGQVIAVRLTSSSSQGTPLSATITAGSYSTTWTVTTNSNTNFLKAITVNGSNYVVTLTGNASDSCNTACSAQGKTCNDSQLAALQGYTTQNSTRFLDLITNKLGLTFSPGPPSVTIGAGAGPYFGLGCGSNTWTFSGYSSNVTGCSNTTVNVDSSIMSCSASGQSVGQYYGSRICTCQ
ncbi:MAG: hypothetical protein EOO39_23770 [Cytophagaceae bacterium]|nr:MAG: hypothetical protein EOO39_23770 [Cytophagaceae bacterium]